MKHSSIWLTPLFFTLLLSPLSTLAQSEKKEDIAGSEKKEDSAEFVEPILTEETLPNEVGEWDLRFSCVFESAPSRPHGDCMQTQLFFGIAQRWGLEVQTRFPSSLGERDEEPVAEVGTTVKYLLRGPTPRSPAIVLAMETTFAAGRREGSEEGRVELQPALALLQPLGRAVLQGNVGFAITTPGESGRWQKAAVYNASLAFPLRRSRWHGFAEVTGASSGDSTQVAFSPGLKYTFHSGHFLAVGVPVGLTSSSPGAGVVFQVQFSLKTKKGEAMEAGRGR